MLKPDDLARPIFRPTEKLEGHRVLEPVRRVRLVPPAEPHHRQLVTWADWFIVAMFLAVMAVLGAIVWHGYSVGVL